MKFHIRDTASSIFIGEGILHSPAEDTDTIAIMDGGIGLVPNEGFVEETNAARVRNSLATMCESVQNGAVLSNI